MREYSVPAAYEIPAAGDLTDLIYDNARRDPAHASFARKIDDDWVDVTAAEFIAQVEEVAKGFVAAGVRPGDRVALMSRTRYEWTLVDFAIWCAGAVTVPIYETSSVEQARWILADSEAVACIVELADHERVVAAARDSAPDLRAVWRLDGAGDGPTLADLVAGGTGVASGELASRRAALGPDSLATLIYTSGTTGRPKGCHLTHGNFLAELGNAVVMLDVLFSPGSSTLLFLPLAHVFARIIEIGAVMRGAKLGHTPDVRSLVPDLGTFKPTFILAVPRVFEKVYNAAALRAQSSGTLKKQIFDQAAAAAVSYSEAQQRGSVSPIERARHAVFDRLVYAKLRASLGGRLEYAISGGAPLGDRLGHFFHGAGLTVIEGYGLTETTAAATANPPDAVKIGTVGRPLPGTTIRIADDGEILVRGGQVMRGYWKNPEATAEALTDGWFRTGDLGELDPDGYLSITGRKKDVIVTAGGKNVVPAVLEDRLRAHPLISQTMVVGDKRAYIAALVTIDPEFFEAWCERHGKPADLRIADATEDPGLRAEIDTAVAEANRAVSRAESIKRYRILAVDFTEEGGQLTPSLKLRRSVIVKEFADEIESLYES
jgi:long-chain acyl-CoA synthetase